MLKESEKKKLSDALGEVESILARLEREKPAATIKKLSEKQQRFSLMFCGLALKIYSEGDTFTHGETFDDDNTGHIKNSTHYFKLAADVNLFVGGVYQTATTAHAKYGSWWERFGGSWGGRFNDGNHYSIKNGGVA